MKILQFFWAELRLICRYIKKWWLRLNATTYMQNFQYYCIIMTLVKTLIFQKKTKIIKSILSFLFVILVYAICMNMFNKSHRNFSILSFLHPMDASWGRWRTGRWWSDRSSWSGRGWSCHGPRGFRPGPIQTAGAFSNCCVARHFNFLENG